MTHLSYHEAVFYNGAYELQGLIQKPILTTPLTSHQDVILCLHGWLDNAASFIPLLPHLSEYTVVAIDLIGHGHSPHRSTDAHYHFFDWIDDVLGLINQQKWERIHLLGHSMGSMISCALAAAFGEKIASVILLDALGFICTAPGNTTKQLQEGLLSRNQIKAKKLTIYPNIERAVQVRMYNGGLTQSSAELMVKRGIKSTAEGYVWRTDPRLHSVSPYRLTLRQAKQLLSDINAPVQLLYGDDGYLADGKAIRAFSDSIQNFQAVEFSGKHHFHMEQAEKTAKFIKEFINNVP